jgi:hypothetical protein
MLTETVCLMLDRMTGIDYVDLMSAGTQFDEINAFGYLGLNQGNCLSNPHYIDLPSLISNTKYNCLDFFRILRSRNDWSGEEFRIAIKTSPFVKYQNYIRENYAHIDPTRRHYFYTAYILALSFSNTADHINLWFGTRQSDGAPPQTQLGELQRSNSLALSQIIQCAIISGNSDLLKALFGGQEPVMTIFDGDYHLAPQKKTILNANMLSLDVRRVVSDCELIETVYSLIFSHYYDILQLKTELENPKKSLMNKKTAQIVQKIKHFDEHSAHYRAQFDFLFNLYGTSLCSIKSIICMYICAKVYGDDATLEKLSQFAQISDENYLSYTNADRISSKHDVPQLRSGLEVLEIDYEYEMDKSGEKNSFCGELISNLSCSFIQNNLPQCVDYIISLYLDKQLSKLGIDTNTLALAASCPIISTTSFNLFLKKVSQTPSFKISKNMFYSALSNPSTQNSFEILQTLFHFVQNNIFVQTSKLSVEDFLLGLVTRFSVMNWDEPDESLYPIIQFCYVNLVEQSAWDEVFRTDKNTQHFFELFFRVLHSGPNNKPLNPDSFCSLRNVQNMHSETFQFIKLILGQKFFTVLNSPNNVEIIINLVKYAVALKNTPLFEFLLQFCPTDQKTTVPILLHLSLTTGKSYDMRDLIILPSKYNITENIKNGKTNSQKRQVSVQNCLENRKFSVSGIKWKDISQFEPEYFDVDFCPLKLSNPRPKIPEIKRLIQGAAKRAGVKGFDYDFFKNIENKYDSFSISGGNSILTDCNIEEYLLPLPSDDQFQNIDYQNGNKFIVQIFQQNNNQIGLKRSPFLSMLEIIIKHIGSNDIDTGIEKFAKMLQVQPVLSIGTSNHLLFLITREVIDMKTVPFVYFSQLFCQNCQFSFVNNKVWLGDLIFDLFFEVMGSTNYTALCQAYEEYQLYQKNDANLQQYIQNFEQNQQNQQNNPELLLPPNTIVSFQQYINLKKPFKFPQITENLLYMFLMLITLSYIETINDFTNEADDEYYQAVEMYEKNGQQIPPKPELKIPKKLLFFTIFPFTFLLNQLNFFPQFLFKILITKCRFSSSDHYLNLYDLYLSLGGDLFSSTISTNLSPLCYSLYIPAAQSDPSLLDFLSLKHHISPRAFGDELARYSAIRRKFSNGEVEMEYLTQEDRNSNNTISTLVLVGVGTLLAAIGGFVYWSSYHTQKMQGGNSGREKRE